MGNINLSCPTGSSAVRIGGGSPEGVAATTASDVFTYSGGKTDNAAVATMWLQANGAGGIIADGGVKLGTNTGMLHSAGGDVNIWAGAAIAANTGSKDGPGAAPGNPNPPAADVASKVMAGMAVNFVMKGITGFATAGPGMYGAWERAKAGWDVLKGGGLGVVAATHNETVEHAIATGDSAIATAESGIALFGGGLGAVGGGVGEFGGVISTLQGGEHTLHSAHGPGHGGGEHPHPEHPHPAHAPGPAGPSSITVDGRPIPLPEGSDAGGALDHGAAGAAGTDASGAASGSAGAPPGGGGKIVAQAPQNIEMHTHANIFGYALSNIEFKAGPIIGAHSRTKIEMTTSIFEAFANVMVEIMATARVDFKTGGKAVVEALRKFEIKTHGVGIIDAHDLDIKGKTKLYAHSGTEVTVQAPTIKVLGKELTIHGSASLKADAPDVEIDGGGAKINLKGNQMKVNASSGVQIDANETIIKCPLFVEKTLRMGKDIKQMNLTVDG